MLSKDSPLSSAFFLRPVYDSKISYCFFWWPSLPSPLSCLVSNMFTRAADSAGHLTVCCNHTNMTLLMVSHDVWWQTVTSFHALNWNLSECLFWTHTHTLSHTQHAPLDTVDCEYSVEQLKCWTCQDKTRKCDVTKRTIFFLLVTKHVWRWNPCGCARGLLGFSSDSFDFNTHYSTLV